MHLPSEEPEEPVVTPVCAVCGRECSDMEINLEFLCDHHFDVWASLVKPMNYTSPHGNGVGSKAQMKDFVDGAKNAR